MDCNLDYNLYKDCIWTLILGLLFNYFFVLFFGFGFGVSLGTNWVLQPLGHVGSKWAVWAPRG